MFFTCKTLDIKTNIYQTANLEIEQITEHTFRHISYLTVEGYGKVACNGMIVIDKGEAIIFDTPTDDSVSLALINWVNKKLKCEIKAIIPTHFHVDCLGGLQAFHQKGISSYASNRTIDFAKSNNKIIPQNGFDKHLELKVGGKNVIAEFWGEGHTKDNIIGYFPSEKVLFGGCLIKKLNAGKGNLADANTKEWSNSVEKIKAKYANAKVVIPGHGKVGGVDLFDYTIELFKE